MKAVWNGATLAESDQTVEIERNHYFPRDSVRMNLLRPSPHTSTCPWKGVAEYFDVVVAGQENRNAAWTYPDPKEAAKHIAGYIAFWKGISVVP